MEILRGFRLLKTERIPKQIICNGILKKVRGFIFCCPAYFTLYRVKQLMKTRFGVRKIERNRKKNQSCTFYVKALLPHHLAKKVIHNVIS